MVAAFDGRRNPLAHPNHTEYSKREGELRVLFETIAILTLGIENVSRDTMITTIKKAVDWQITINELGNWSHNNTISPTIVYGMHFVPLISWHSLRADNSHIYVWSPITYTTNNMVVDVWARISGWRPQLVGDSCENCWHHTMCVSYVWVCGKWMSVCFAVLLPNDTLWRGEQVSVSKFAWWERVGGCMQKLQHWPITILL